MNKLRPVFAFIRLGRPHFLLGGLILNLLGVSVALYSGVGFNLAALIWGQVAITAAQLMTHYANDYFDRDADRANLTPTHWSGGSRVLTDNLLAPCIALNTALTLAVIALTADLILCLLIRPGLGTLILLLIAQGLAWFYSAPPIRLHSRGIGELTTALIVPLLTPLTGFYLQGGKLALLPILASAPLCCFQFAMLLSIEFPDEVGDRLSGKRTLVVRLGARSAARLYQITLLTAYALLPLLLLAGLPLLVALAYTALLPLALWQIRRIRRGDWHNPARWNGLAFYSIVLLIASAAAELVAFILLIGLFSP